MTKDPITVGGHNFSRAALVNWIQTQTNKGVVPALNPVDRSPLVSPFSGKPLTPEDIMKIKINTHIRENARNREKEYWEGIYEKAESDLENGDYELAKKGFEKMEEAPEGVVDKYKQAAKALLEIDEEATEATKKSGRRCSIQ